MSDSAKSTTEADLAKQLVGLTVTLSAAAAFFFEDNSHYVLNAYPDINGIDDKGSEFKDNRVVIKEGWKLGPTLKNIRAGILRVIDKAGVDISSKFGGPVVLNRRKVPLVTDNMIPRMDEDSQRDQNLRKILSDVDEDKILQIISSSKAPFEVLQRFMQLELAGENPSFQSRQKIVDGIKDLIKMSGAVGMPGKIEDGVQETVTTVHK